MIYDEIEMECLKMIDLIKWYKHIQQLPNCYDCGKYSSCEYKPDNKDIRINCPLWIKRR